VSLLQISRAVVRDPNLSVVVFPDQDLERQIDCAVGRGEHDGRSGFGVSKNCELGWPHFHPNLCCFATVVDHRKQGDFLLCEDSLQPGNSLIHRMTDRKVDHPLFGMDAIKPLVGHDPLIFRLF
jgi:hypothetical protein